MTVSPAPTPRPRRRWLRVALVFVLLCAAAGFGWYWFELRPQLAARRPFIGTWRREFPSSPDGPEFVHEMELRADGFDNYRVRNAKTGTVVLDLIAELRWRIVDGRLQRGHYGITGLNDLGIGPWSFVTHDGKVEWEGPNRFRYQDDKTGLGSEVWIRIEPAPTKSAHIN